MQRYEMDAWLGGDHGLTDEQVTDLMRTADEIGERYPDADDDEQRQAALTTAYRLMVEDPETVVDEQAHDLLRARLAETRSLASLRQAARDLVATADRSARGIRSQAGYASRAGVDRRAVREWIDA